jgi:hypothetical protein
MHIRQPLAVSEATKPPNVDVCLSRLFRNAAAEPTWLVSIKLSGSNIVAFRKFPSFDESLAFAEKVMADLGIARRSTYAALQ